MAQVGAELCAHLAPQRVLVVREAGQRHGDDVQVPASCGTKIEQKSQFDSVHFNSHAQ